MSAVTVECPHCYSDVLLMEDGRCPSCLMEAGASPEHDECFTKANLKQGAAGVPGVCVSCGTPTSRIVPFVRKVKNERYSNKISSGGAIGLMLTWAIDYASGKMHQEIQIDVPQCEACQAKRVELRVKYLDFDTKVATFIVHKNFKQALGTVAAH